MSNRVHDSEKNAPFKRGVVKEIDAARGRAKVEFSDEDGNISYWLNVNQAVTGANKSYSMPDVDSQVNCLVDWDGEDGTILGAVWSEVDAPPTSDGDIEHRKYESGAEIIVNRKTGDMTIKSPGNIDLESTTLTHNGKNISSDHKHKDVTPGAGLTGVPV